MLARRRMSWFIRSNSGAQHHPVRSSGKGFAMRTLIVLFANVLLAATTVVALDQPNPNDGFEWGAKPAVVSVDLVR
jgi:hypothetical protein